MVISLNDSSVYQKTETQLSSVMVDWLFYVPRHATQIMEVNVTQSTNLQGKSAIET